MSSSVTSVLAFQAQLADRLRHLSQFASAQDPAGPAPAEELQLYRAECAVYDEIFTRAAASHGTAEALDRSFVRSVLPCMEATARNLAGFSQELAAHGPLDGPLDGPLRSPVEALRARLLAGLLTVYHQFPPVDARP